MGKCTSSGSGNYTCTCPFSFFFGKNSTTGKLTCIEGNNLTYVSLLYKSPYIFPPGPCKSKPCGVGKCTDFGGGKYNCTCPKKYTSRINPSTGKLTCLPGIIFMEILSLNHQNLLPTHSGSCVPNPCGVGKCSESTNGDYSCTCPKSHFLGYNASKVKTCLSGNAYFSSFPFFFCFVSNFPSFSQNFELSTDFTSKAPARQNHVELEIVSL